MSPPRGQPSGFFCSSVRVSILQVEHLQAEPGTRTQGYLCVAEMLDGTPVRLPIVLINGAKPGPTIYLQSISDGDELNGVAVIRRVIKRVDSARLSGRIIAVPIVNIHAFHAKQSHSPVDGKKMNRCFPGRKDGTSSDRIAHHLFQHAVLQSDYCVDLHQGGIRPMVDEVRVRVDRRKRIHKACMEMATVFGIGYILDSRGPDGQLARCAPDEGVPTIDPELGGCPGWDESSIKKGVTGVENLLKHFGLISGKPLIPKRQAVVDGLLSVLSNRGGFVEYKAELYDHLQKGDPVAEITDPFGDVLETLVAPEESILWSQCLRPMVASGESVGNLGKNIRFI